MKERFVDMGARIARYELPGRRWYFASCQACRWIGLDWKHLAPAKHDRDEHNATQTGGWVSQTPPEAALALMDATPETRRYAPSAALPIDNRASDTGGSGS